MSYDAQNAAVRSAILAFTAELKTKLEDTAANAENATYAENSGKLEGLTLNEVVELIAGTTGLTIQDVQTSLDDFIARRDNPHEVTAEQIGLGLVDNFATATDAEAAGVSYDYYATNDQTVFTGTDEDGETMELQDGAIVYIEKNGNRVGESDYTVDVAADTVTLVNAAASADYSYTATDGQTEFSGADDASATLSIGSGQHVSVSNGATALVSGTDYTIDYANNAITLTSGATAGDVIDITVSDNISIRVVTVDRFLTPTVLWNVLDVFWSQKVGSAPAALDTIAELAAALENNPDIIDNLTTQIGEKADQADIDASIAALTKADVGLGDVENFALATEQEAIDGTSTTTYVTPALVKAHTDAVAQGLQSNIDAKATQADIDAAVGALTKADVGLDLVENYAIASESEALGNEYSYTATADQTAFSGADSASNTLAFEDTDTLVVRVNGEEVAFTSDAATDTVTLGTAAAADDVVTIRTAINTAYMSPARALAVRADIESDVNSSLAALETAFNDALADLQAPAA